MATRKPTPKPAPKPVRKPAPKPAPKTKPQPVPLPAPTPTPKPAPLDLVRNPNFDSAMAQQNYQNAIAEMQAKIEAERGLAEANSNLKGQLPPQGGGGQDIIDKDRFERDTRDRGPQAGSGPDFIDNRDPNKAYTMNMFNYYDPATGEVTSRTNGIAPGPGSRFVRYYGPSPQGLGGDMVGFVKRDPRDPNTQYGGPIDPERKLPPEGGGTQQPRQPGQFGDDQLGKGVLSDEDKRKIYDGLMARQGQLYAPGGGMAGIPSPIPEAPQGAMASQYPIPQGQQMQDYQNFLKQGMQNSNALNQGAMASFANTQPGMQVPQVPQAGVQIPQPGMQTPQAGIAKPQNPNMAGMVTRQRRQNPAQGKFSTFSNKPARFF